MTPADQHEQGSIVAADSAGALEGHNDLTGLKGARCKVLRCVAFVALKKQ
jgi:hypothetical protein